MPFLIAVNMYVCLSVRCAVQEVLKAARRQYLQAHEQIFFPLNIEVQKAETRVMTYLAREEIRYRTRTRTLALIAPRFHCDQRGSLRLRWPALTRAD